MGEVGRSSERARTIRGEDLNLVIAKNDAIAGRLADQSACDWRAVGDRPRSGNQASRIRYAIRRPSSPQPYKSTALNMWRDAIFEHVCQAKVAKRRIHRKLGFVDSQGPGDVDSNRSAPSRSNSQGITKPSGLDPVTDAAMIAQIGRFARSRASSQIARGPHDCHSQVRTDAHRDHVLFELLAHPDFPHRATPQQCLETHTRSAPRPGLANGVRQRP